MITFDSSIIAEELYGIVTVGDRAIPRSVGICPQCGGSCTLANDSHRSIQNAYQSILAPGRSVDDIQALVGLLRGVAGREMTPQEVADELDERAPKFARLRGLLPDNKSDLYTFLALLTALAQLAVQVSTTKEEAPERKPFYIRCYLIDFSDRPGFNKKGALRLEFSMYMFEGKERGFTPLPGLTLDVDPNGVTDFLLERRVPASRLRSHEAYPMLRDVLARCNSDLNSPSGRKLNRRTHWVRIEVSGNLEPKRVLSHVEISNDEFKNGGWTTKGILQFAMRYLP